jgi:hypothetical protein
MTMRLSGLIFFDNGSSFDIKQQQPAEKKTNSFFFQNANKFARGSSFNIEMMEKNTKLFLQKFN